MAHSSSATRPSRLRLGARAIKTRLFAPRIQDVPKATFVPLQVLIDDHTRQEAIIREDQSIQTYRDWDEKHKGVTPKEFWQLAKAAGVTVPAEARTR